MRGLALLDMDGTILSKRTIDELCKAFGKSEALSRLDEMSNDMSEYEVAQEIGRLFSGVRREEMEEVFDSIPLNRGVQDLISFLKKNGLKPVIVTDSYQFLAERLARRLGIKCVYGNITKFRDGIFAGELILRYPCMKVPNCREYSLCKLRILQSLKSAFGGMTIAVGDGGSDICMVQGADIGVAYRPKSEVLRRVAKITVTDFSELIKILKSYLDYNIK